MVRIEVPPLFGPKHTMVTPEYTRLKDLITLKVSMSESHSQILQAMKGLYQNAINSARRYEQIGTIGQLLKILEVRDVLSEENILPLQVLAQRLPDNPDNIEIMNIISGYETSRVSKQNINHYAVEHNMQQSAPHNKPPPKDNAGEYSRFSDGLCDEIRERIIEAVVEEIGQYWRNLARYLGVAEWKIDEIQCSGKKVEEKAIEIMEIYKKKADRKKWFFDLLDALEKSRRRELCDKLKNIATMNI